MTKHTVREATSTLRVQSTKAGGSRINKKVKEEKSGLMAATMKDSI